MTHDLFIKQWIKFRDKKQDEKLKGDELTRLLAAEWVACVLKTYIAFSFKFFDCTLNKFSDTKDLEKNKKNTENTDYIDYWEKIKILTQFLNEDFQKRYESGTERYIKDLESESIKVAHNIYSLILEAPRKKQVIFASKPMKDWLEQKLPLLFSYFYVPIDNSKGEADLRWKTMTSFKPKLKQKSKLTKYWEDNIYFIIADIYAEYDPELKKLLSTGQINFPGEFSALSNWLKNNHSSGSSSNG